MSDEFKEWFYLIQISKNFEGLIFYFFQSASVFAPYIKGAAIPVIVGMGVISLALRLAKSPIDRFKSLVIGATIFAVSSFLLTGTTKTNNLGPASGTELSIGAYYSYYTAGLITQMFNDTIDNSWASVVNEQAGGGPGLLHEALSIAWVDAAEQFADIYIQGEGKDAYVDYHSICAPEALAVAKTTGQTRTLEAIGIGSNTLGMSPAEFTTVSQFALRNENGDSSWSDRLGKFFSMEPGSLVSQESAEIKRRAEAEEILKTGLIEANNAIDGTKGYRIPTSDYYERYFGETVQADSSPTFSRVSGSSDRLSELHPNGQLSQDPSSEQDFYFYPQNCYDLYLVASATMQNFRTGVKNYPAFKDMGYSQAFNSISASRHVRKGLNSQIQEQTREMGHNAEFDSSFVEDISDNSADFFKQISSSINKWMLEFQIPATITSMALLVVILIISFPIFAVMSVVLGHHVLTTYLKLMFLPFIVVFIHKFFLIMTTSIIAYSNSYELLIDTRYPGGVDTPAKMAAGNFKVIVFTLITVSEIAIAKFLLWDDVRAITSFNPSQFVKNALKEGVGYAAQAGSLAVAPFSAAGRVAAAVGSRSRAIQSIGTLKTIAGNTKPKPSGRIAPSPTGSGTNSG